MAVIFAVVGGGAVLGIATSPDYGDYGCLLYTSDAADE